MQSPAADAVALVAEWLYKAGLRPRRTLRFQVFWGARAIGV